MILYTPSAPEELRQFSFRLKKFTEQTLHQLEARVDGIIAQDLDWKRTSPVIWSFWDPGSSKVVLVLYVGPRRPSEKEKARLN